MIEGSGFVSLLMDPDPGGSKTYGPTDPDLDPDRQDCDTHLPTDHAILHFKKPMQKIYLILVYLTSEKIKKALENPIYFQMRLQSLRKHLHHNKKISLSVSFKAYSSDTQSDPDERGIFYTFLY
jgi:hypothetical protein